MQNLLRIHFTKIGLPVKLLLLLIIFGSSSIFSQLRNPAIELSPASIIRNQGMYIIKADKNGRIYDTKATPEEYEKFARNSLSKANKKMNYTLVRSINQPESVRGLKIILRATDQLMANPAALMSFRRAAARWERVINTPITVVIDVDYGPTRWGEAWGSTTLGSTGVIDMYAGQNASVIDVKNALKAKHPNDTQLQSLYNAIPNTVHTTKGTNLNLAVGAQILLQALGFLPADTNPDPAVNPFDNVPNIGFNSNFKYDFDPSDGIDGDKEDFDATVVHEMGHALGFDSIIMGYGYYPDGCFTPWDLFRVRPAAVSPGNLTQFSAADKVVTPGPPPSEVQIVENGVSYYKDNQVFFDGITEMELSTGDGSSNGGDGQQASHWRDDVLRPPSLGADRFIGIMDPVSQGTGIRSVMNHNDLRALEVIGFDINYSPKFAGISVMFGGKTIDLNKSLDTLKLGDVNVNSSKNVQLQFTNLSLDNTLNYEIEVIPAHIIPASSTAALTAGSAEGSVTSGQSANINLTLNGGQTSSISTGILRLHTNDENKLVIDIPYEFSSGNATAPTVAFSVPKIEDFRFEKSTPTNTLSKEVTIYNKGSLDLDYTLITSLTTKSNYPSVVSLAKTANSNLEKNNLSHFYDLKKIQDKLIYSNDFENQPSGFTKEGKANIEDWNLTTKGKASLDGHSKPTAAYFGHDYGDSLQTKPYSDAMFVSPTITLDPTPAKDLVTLSFNYYLDAEVGYDFAYVLLSTDNGTTYKEVASSNGGILQNTTAWQTVLLQLPYLSGNVNPTQIKIAFKFTSDQLENREGFYVDDVQLNAITDGNSLYPSINGGVIPGNGSTTITLTANKTKLQLGYYAGSLTVLSNDPKHSSYDFNFNVANLQANISSLNTLYGVTYRSGGKFILLHPSDGSAIELGSAGGEGIKSLAINPATLQMYAINVLSSYNAIVILDAHTGTALFYVKPDVKLDAITFDKSGTLYGVGSDLNLYTVNLQTGKTTLIKKIGIKAAAMVFHPSTGELYISVDALSNKDKLYKVNAATGDTTFVGRTGTGKTTRGLAFDINNNLYGVVGEILQASTFLSINTQNAAATEIGPVGYSAVFGLALKPDTSTAVTRQPVNVPSKFTLGQNYPNPFNPSTMINYQIPEANHVSLKVFNILGQEVATLVDKFQSAGNYSVEFKADNLSTGIYLYELRTDKFVSVKKMILSK